jgi:hypothetical protein
MQEARVAYTLFAADLGDGLVVKGFRNGSKLRHVSGGERGERGYVEERGAHRSMLFCGESGENLLRKKLPSQMTRTEEDCVPSRQNDGGEKREIHGGETELA